MAYFRATIQLLLGFLLSKKSIWNLVNRNAIKGYYNTPNDLSNEQNRILDDLKINGIAITNLDFFRQNALVDINYYLDSLEPKKSDVKNFLTYYLGGEYRSKIQEFSETNPLLEFSFNSKLVSIINSYFGMLSRLCYLELNETILSSSEPLQMSQNFHRDPGIQKCIKVFIYLNDVGIDSGPFVYLKKSHLNRENSFNSKRYGAGGIYPEKVAFEKSIDVQNITPICGSAGTVIIADTTGFHCGGNSITSTRKMATIVYYPPGDLKKSKIKCTIPDYKKIYETSSYLLP